MEYSATISNRTYDFLVYLYDLQNNLEHNMGAAIFDNIIFLSNRNEVNKRNQIAHDQKHEQGQGLEKEDDNESFASMIRRSKLLQLGKPEGKIVSGHVFEVFVLLILIFSNLLNLF
jgi:hypothetical protein